MAPEYIMHGQFSVKSDVFSFGILVLEIVCGQKNNSFHNGDRKTEDLSSFVSIMSISLKSYIATTSCCYTYTHTYIV